MPAFRLSGDVNGVNMRKPIGLRTDQKILKQQLRLIDKLATENAAKPGPTGQKHAGLLDGLANWVSLINQQLEKGGDVVVYPAGVK